jgi:hypothetical protein
MLLPALSRVLWDGILLEACNPLMYGYGLKSKKL